MRDPRIDRLTREILGLQRQIRGLSISSRLVNASIEDGTIHEFDREGNLVGTIGKQHDGTHGAVILDGPKPPRPSVPVATGGPLNITVAWDGRYASEEDRAPLDFHVVEVYAAAAPFEDYRDAILIGTFPDEAGGRLTIARAKGAWHVALVAKSIPGKRSELSDLAVAEAQSSLDPAVLAELDEKLDALRAELDALEDETLPELRLDLDRLRNETLPDLEGELDAARGQLAAAFPDGVFDVGADINGAREEIGKAIAASLDEYVVTDSFSDPPPASAPWSADTPDWEPGQYVWRRTRNTHIDQSVTYSAPAVITGEGKAGEDAVLLRVSSSRGTSFKNNAISTTLSVTVFKGSQQIRNLPDLWAALGPSAYLEWLWRRIDDSDFGIISSADPRLSQGGFALTVSPADVDEQTVFQCILHT